MAGIRGVGGEKMSKAVILLNGQEISYSDYLKYVIVEAIKAYGFVTATTCSSMATSCGIPLRWEEFSRELANMYHDNKLLRMGLDENEFMRYAKV